MRRIEKKIENHYNIAIFSILFVLIFALGCIVPSPEKTRFHCDTINCFKERLAKCEQASYSIVEDFNTVVTNVFLSIDGPQENACKISVEIFEIKLKASKPQNETEEKIQKALNEFFETLKRNKAYCLFTTEEAQTADFRSTSFLFEGNCSGKLKQSLTTLAEDIEHIIYKAIGG